MLKTGIYKWESDEPGIFGGFVKVKMKETSASFIITLLENACRYNAPQLDELFRESPRVVIRKDGSKHALNIDGDDWFCLYPYRVGTPYAFRYEGKE